MEYHLKYCHPCSWQNTGVLLGAPEYDICNFIDSQILARYTRSRYQSNFHLNH